MTLRSGWTKLKNMQRGGKAGGERKEGGVRKGGRGNRTENLDLEGAVWVTVQ